MTQAQAPARSRRRLSAAARRVFPGDRRVWIAGGAVLGVGLMVILVALLVPRDYYTGTNSVRTRSFPIELAKGDELCVTALNVPSGTGRVQIEIDTGPAHIPTLTGTLRVRGERASAPVRIPGESFPGRRKVEFPVPERPSSPRAKPAEFCVHTEGKVFIGGMADLYQGDVPVRVNGDDVEHRVAVWFLPPEGEKRSVVSQLPTIFQRASLFRPSFAAPAFYWLLILAWMPLLMYLALRLLATASTRSLRRLAVGVGLLAFGNAAAWALVTPAFNSPDESEHFAYVQWFAETGDAVARSVEQNPNVYSTDQTIALNAVRLFSNTEAPDGRPPWLPVDEDQWREQRRIAARGLGERAPPRDNGGGSATATTVHSPAYYAMLAPAYHMASGGSTWDQLTAARLTSALFGLVAAICAFLIVREFVPRHPVPAAAAGLLVGFQPMFAFMSGSVNNDMGVNAAAAVVIWLVVRGFLRGLTWRTGLALGVIIAVMPVLKGTGYALYPLLLLAFVVMLWRRHSRADVRGYAALAAGFLVTAFAWSLLSSSFDQSAVTTPGGGAPATGAKDNPFGYLSYLWQVFLPPLPFMSDLFIYRWPFFNIYIERGWAAFGWYSVLFPQWVYLVILAVTGVVGLLGVRMVWKNRGRARHDWPALLFVVAVPAVILAAIEAAYYGPVPRAVLPEFGRYLFPAMAALAAMAVGASFAFGRRWAPVGATALVCAVVVLNYASQFLTLSGFYT